jgi:SAM-dependent methyltransferase
VTPQADAAYGADYYQHYSPRTYERSDYWLTIFRALADRIVETIGPRRVLDAGCAMGLLVEALRERGVEADGVDVSTYAIAHAPEPVKAYCRVASVTEPLPARYDLIVCIEVLEHLSGADAAAAVANFCRHADDVLFSSTPMHFRDTSHLNVQPPEYWAERFAEHGFYRDVDFDASFVCPWAVRFRRGTNRLPRIVADYERRFARLEYERNERRVMAEDLELQLTAARTRIAELLQGQQRLDDTNRDLAAARAELDAAQARAGSLEHELTMARGTVQNMEHSAFWRARGVWVAIRRLFGARS